MVRSYHALSILIIIVSALSFIFDGSTALPQLSSDRIKDLAAHGDTESRFALGSKILLADATIFDLELISGIGDELAGKILEQRPHLMKLGVSTPCEHVYKIFEEVNGIGLGLAHQLAERVTLSSQCNTTH